MNHHIEIQEGLADYVEGVLSTELQASTAEHLAGCAECREEVEFLTSLRRQTAELPEQIEPPRDLWAGIAARLEEPRVSETVIPIGRRAGRTIRWRGPALVAMAASVLVAVTAGITAHLMRPADQTIAPAIATAPASVEARPMTSFAAFEPMEREYIGTLELLEAELDARRSSLSPETLKVVDENIAIIDTALAEIRAALLADSTSVELPLLLSGVYRSKVELLRNTVQLSAST